MIQRKRPIKLIKYLPASPSPGKGGLQSITIHQIDISRIRLRELRTYLSKFASMLNFIILK